MWIPLGLGSFFGAKASSSGQAKSHALQDYVVDIGDRITLGLDVPTYKIRMSKAAEAVKGFRDFQESEGRVVIDGSHYREDGHALHAFPYLVIQTTPAAFDAIKKLLNKEPVANIESLQNRSNLLPKHEAMLVRYEAMSVQTVSVPPPIPAVA